MKVEFPTCGTCQNCQSRYMRYRCGKEKDEVFTFTFFDACEDYKSRRL